ncbi:MAG: hypothetical protein AB4042_17260 [Leptolyngbyaceae cyanobacterium]
MPTPKILQENESYTFRSFFEMPYEPDQILAELGYQFVSDRLALPQSQQSLTAFAQLQQDIEASLKLTRLSSETARREVMIAPILLAIARFCQCQIRLEYPLHVNSWLKGNLDYLLRSQQRLLVVEAKKEDLSRGFTQLAAEMIALAEAEDQEIVYGAVTIGDGWRFGQLDRTTHTITQDILLYSVPLQLDPLLQILVGIVESCPDEATH